MTTAAPTAQPLCRDRTITLVDGTTRTGLCYEYMNGPFPSGDWLMLDRGAGWFLLPHYRVASVSD